MEFSGTIYFHHMRFEISTKLCFKLINVTFIEVKIQIDFKKKMYIMFLKACSFAIRVWFMLSPLPFVVKDHLYIFWDPSLGVIVLGQKSVFYY